MSEKFEIENKVKKVKKNYRAYNQGESMFIVFDERYISPNSLVAHVNKVVDNLDLSKFNIEIEKNEFEKGGRPGYNPLAKIKVIIMSYCNDIYSSRKMEERCNIDIEYVYLTGNAIIDHSTISRFIQNNKEALLEIASQVLYILDEKGFLSKDLTVVDSTKIKGNASKRFNGTLEDFKNKKEKLEEHVKTMVDKHIKSDDEESKKTIENKIEDTQAEIKKIDEFLKNVNKEESRKTYNLTDADTRKMKTADGAYINGYLAQVAVEEKNHFIVATEVFSESNDYNCGPEFIKSIPVIEEQLNKKNKTEVELNNIENENKSQQNEIDNNKESEEKKTIKILTDGGYGNIDLLVELEQNNIDAYIPVSKIISGAESSEKIEESKNKINAAHCELKEKNGGIILECPGKQQMSKHGENKEKNKEDRNIFVPDPKKCKQCGFNKRCYGTIKNRKTFKITKSICEHYQTIQRMREKLESEQGKEIYAKRKTIIEHVNGEIKELHHFRAFSYRGRKKVNVQWGLVCLAYNIRKWHKLEKAA